MEFIDIDTPVENQFVCVLSKKVEPGRAMNALGHMTAGFVDLYPDSNQLRFRDYVDADGGKHQNISDNPFIVLSAKNGNQIRTLRNALIEKGIIFTDFTHTMVEGTNVEQHKRTNATAEENLEYYGICFFMNAAESRELTKKFSLYS